MTVVVGNIEIDVLITEASKEIKEVEDNHWVAAPMHNVKRGGDEVNVWKEMVSDDEVFIDGRGSLERATIHSDNETETERDSTDATKEEEPLEEIEGGDIPSTIALGLEFANGEGRVSDVALGIRASVTAEKSMKGSTQDSLGGEVGETNSINCHDEPREGGCLEVNSIGKINEGKSPLSSNKVKLRIGPV